MSNLAEKFQVEQLVRPEHQPQPAIRKVSKRIKISKGEKFLWSLLGLFIFFGSITIITTNAELHRVDMENSQLISQIETLEQTTTELEIYADSLNTYERIAEVAREHGLTINEENVQSLDE